MKHSYKDLRVLVIGGLGFIGLNLVKTLFDAEAIITIANRSSSPLTLSWLELIARGRPYELLTNVDLTNSKYFNIFDTDIVFDLAGSSGAAQSLLHAHHDMQTNIEFHLYILETIRKLNKKPRIVFTSSRLVYGPMRGTSVHEDDTCYPTSLYGLHKLTVEHYLRLYSLHYDVPFTVLRLTNPYGPYQSPLKKAYGIINQFIMAAIREDVITIYGDGKQLRDYIYVQDAVDAITIAAVSPAMVNQIANIGYGQSISIKDIASMIVQTAQSGQIVAVDWPTVDLKVETGDFISDISRAHELMNWKPRFHWQEGIELSIEGYRETLNV